MSALQIGLKKLMVRDAGAKAVVIRDGAVLKGHLYLVCMSFDADPMTEPNGRGDAEWYLQHMVNKMEGTALIAMPLKSTDDVYVSSPARCHHCREGMRDLCVFCFGGYL